MKSYDNFRDAIHDSAAYLLDHGEIVDTKSWQGKVDDERFSTLEVMAYSFTCPISPDLSELHKDVRPNLPWADRHFEERVSGIPYNPPPSYKEWPYWNPKSEETKEVISPDVDERDWAYLAALIDGEGSLTYVGNKRKTGGGRPGISIPQKDGEFLRGVYESFYQVGRFYPEPERDRSVWHITRKSQTRWVLSHVIPYLRLKRIRAEEMLKFLKEKPSHHADKPAFSSQLPRFSHTYPERFWPPRGFGIRYPYGNLDSVVNLLARDPYTRQATFPIFFPEDTGASHKGRIPCTLLYHFLMRRGRLNLFYDIRSCDCLRHFQDDVYLACRLLLWVLERLHDKGSEFWARVTPGQLVMNVYSFHIFKVDIPVLKYRLERGIV